MRNALKVGDWVRSHFRATWKGVVQGSGYCDNCVYVLVLIDQHNNPMKKVMIKHLNERWLTKIDPPANAKELMMKVPHYTTIQMSKNLKGTVYRTPPTEKHPKGDRWIFVEDYPEHPHVKDWMMARVSDGHRMMVDPRRLTIEA